MQAAQRRILALCLAMYVDDSNVTDLASAEGAGQLAAQCLCTELGTPVAPQKTREMAATGDFLGILHDFTDTQASGKVAFWARESLVDKAVQLIAARRKEDRLTPGDASKLRGLLGFVGRPAWQGVGKAAMGALRQRQYSDKEPWSLSNCLRRALDFFDLILDERPRRFVDIQPRSDPLILIASDARASRDALPTGGYVMLDCADGFKQAEWCVFDQDLLNLWGYTPDALDQGGQPIALCEGAMPPIIYQRHARRLANRRVLYLIDNTSALHCYVKGCAVPSALDRSIAFTNFVACHGAICTWWEFTPSGTNWSDGISRLLGADPFVRKHGFPTSRLPIDKRIWLGALESAWLLARGVPP